MYQCVRCTVWIKAYASKLTLGGFQCSGLSVSDFPELRFPRTRIFTGNAIVVDKTVNTNGCSNTNANNGNGWRLGAQGDYATKFVSSIAVDANGVITATAIAGNGLNSAAIQVVPHNGAAATDNGVIDWQRNNTDTVSTCIAQDLC